MVVLARFDFRVVRGSTIHTQVCRLNGSRDKFALSPPLCMGGFAWCLVLALVGGAAISPPFCAYCGRHIPSDDIIHVCLLCDEIFHSHCFQRHHPCAYRPVSDERSRLATTGGVGNHFTNRFGGPVESSLDRPNGGVDANRSSVRVVDRVCSTE